MYFQLKIIKDKFYVFDVLRWVLGVLFIVFGLNGFFQFIPVPPLHPWMATLLESGYLYLVKAVEVAGGLLLISKKYHRIGIIQLTPVVVNILAYHVFIDPRNAAVSWFIAAAFITLIVHDRAFWGTVLQSSMNKE